MTLPAAAVAAASRRRDQELGRVRATPLRGVMVATIALALWLGAAILFTAIVAPAAFAVLPTRMLAGAVVGRVLPTIFGAGIVAGLIAHLGATKAGLRASLVTRIGGILLVVGCAAAQFGIGPRISALRERLPANMETLPADNPERVEFGRLHGYSVLLLGLAMVGSVVTLAGTLRGAAQRLAEEPDDA